MRLWLVATPQLPPFFQFAYRMFLLIPEDTDAIRQRYDQVRADWSVKAIINLDWIFNNCPGCAAGL
jgi:hypothetical protein